MKKCTHCNQIKPFSKFYKNRKMSDGYSNWCSDCMTEYRKTHKKEKQKYMKEYQLKNNEKICLYQKKYREKNKIQCVESNRKYRNSFAKYKLFYLKIQNIEEFRQDPNNLELIQVRCKYCNKWFNPTYSQLNSRVKILNEDRRINNLYCSNECKKACPIFGKQKYPKKQAPATSREVQPELRKLVLERDNWTCQKCNRTDVELHCHHIDPVINNPIESADIDNCITLCKECHKEVHKHPGCNTSELHCK